MGKYVRRVPLNFHWPLKKTWGGFLNPWYRHCVDCDHCEGHGYNPETLQLYKTWYTHLGKNGLEEGWRFNLTQDEVDELLKNNRLWSITRRPRNQEETDRIGTHPNGWLKADTHHPTADEVNRHARQHSMFHDSSNQRICVQARAKRLGVYGKCPTCKGTGELWISENSKRKAVLWRETPPPSGDGYQLWENTTEGSPITPVCPDLHSLAVWAAENKVDPEMTVDMWIRNLVHGEEIQIALGPII